MNNKLYKVVWLDITNFTNRKLESPYSDYLTKSFTIGRILKDKDTILVINSENDESDICGDAIPLGCVVSIKAIK